MNIEAKSQSDVSNIKTSTQKIVKKLMKSPLLQKNYPLFLKQKRRKQMKK